MSPRQVTHLLPLAWTPVKKGAKVFMFIFKTQAMFEVSEIALVLKWRQKELIHFDRQSIVVSYDYRNDCCTASDTK